MKRKLLAVTAAALLLAGCGYIKDFSEDGTDKNAPSKKAEMTIENTEEAVNNGEAENGNEEQNENNPESGENTVAEDNSEAEDVSDTKESEPDENGSEAQGTYYVNDEFGFSLPLPEGTEFYENDDVLKPSFDDDDVLFRSLMDTKSNDLFNMTVLFLETDKTFFDFTGSRYDYCEQVYSEYVANGNTGDLAEVLRADEIDICGYPSLIIEEKLEGANGSFYSVMLYVNYEDSHHIYVRGNCYDEDTLSTLSECAQSIYFR